MATTKDQIIKLLHTQKDASIARMFNVSRQYIYQVRKQKGIKRPPDLPSIDPEYLASAPKEEVMKKHNISYYKYLKLKNRKEVEDGTKGKDHSPNS